MNTLEGPAKDKNTRVGELKPSVQVGVEVKGQVGVPDAESYVRRQVPVAGYMHTVTENAKIPDFMTYDGRKLTAHFQQEVPVQMVDNDPKPAPQRPVIPRSHSYVPLYKTPPPGPKLNSGNKPRNLPPLYIPSPPSNVKYENRPSTRERRNKRPFMFATAKNAWFTPPNVGKNPSPKSPRKTSSSFNFPGSKMSPESSKYNSANSSYATPLNSPRKYGIQGSSDMPRGGSYKPNSPRKYGGQGGSETSRGGSYKPIFQRRY